MRVFWLAVMVAAVTAGALWFTAAPAPGGKPAGPAAAQETATQAREPSRKGPPPAGVPVLMYHKIGPEAGNDAVISEARFAEHMEYLHRNGYRTLSLAELEDYLAGRTELPPKPVVITFDDGYRDTYEVALPILKRYGFKSTVFVILNAAERHLTWAELKAMKAAGMEVGSHSYTHRDLGELKPAEQAAEIARSKEELDRGLGQDSRYFCYPNGSYDGNTLRLLQENGFRLAVTIDPGWVKRGDNPLLLKRVWMGNGVDLRHFEARLTREDYPIL
jgi:peptidoglycan/xylan/chitin deacetylase (PgdA/CDA1 family)